MQDVIISAFLASNLYAIDGCRWFSPSVVILGMLVAFSSLHSPSFCWILESRHSCMTYLLVRTDEWQATSCAGIVQWTFFNVVFLSYLINAHDTTPWMGAPLGRPDPLVMDAPIAFHWPKLLLWAGVEGSVVAAGVLQIHEGRAAVAAAQVPGVDCRTAAYHLRVSPALAATTCTAIGLLALYLAGNIFFLMRAFAELRKRSYRRYRVANTFIRVQVRWTSSGCL